MPLVRTRASAGSARRAACALLGTDSHDVVAVDRGISVFAGVGAVDCGDALGIHTHSQRCACASCARTRMSMAECACGGVRGSHTCTCVRGATLESTSAAGAGFAASARGAARLMSSQAAGAAVVDAAPATMHELPNQQVKVLMHQLLEQLTLDSVKRKRKRKMNKHKYRKRRKATNR